MTSTQIAELHFDGNCETAKKALQRLKAADLISEKRRRVSDFAVLFLAPKAFRLLKAEGILAEYPPFDLPALQKRSQVGEMTIRHELQVQDVKAAFHRALRGNETFGIEEFVTWPLLYQFTARNPFGRDVVVKPDGFIRIHEAEEGTKGYEHAFFLEVDRSSELQETLVQRAACYVDYYKSGGFAEWMGGTRLDPAEFPFRILMVFKTAERRNNFAERLLQLNPPIFTQAYLTTLEEVTDDPLGAIWIRPADYREATKGSRFDPDRETKKWGYKRQTEREMLVAERIKKENLFLGASL